MRATTAVARESSNSHRIENFDLGFLPSHLTRQCRSLIESYHEVHGYACLPDVLWKSRLGPFIEKHRELRQYLRKASTTRSAKNPVPSRKNRSSALFGENGGFGMS